MTCLSKELGSKLDIFYEGDGHTIAQSFYIPVLKNSQNYSRLSGYFSVDSLVVVAAGLAGLINNKGTVRLVVGAHDVGPEIKEAFILSRDRAQQLLREIGDRITNGLESIEDVIARRRLEALAWMLANGTLEIKVAVPKKTFMGLGNGIFHEKLMIFVDSDGCKVGAGGSANETRMAYEQNGENLTLHMSWKPGHTEYINRYEDKFNALWNGEHPDYFVFTLPEALEKKLKERFYPEHRPKIDPLEDPMIRKKIPSIDLELCSALVPLARLMKELGNIKGFAHLGLGPVRLYPHQAYAVDFVLSRFPYRALLADEVGLGKTLEAGGIIKRLVDSGLVQRILILTPKNVSWQWLDELWHHFGLRFWLLLTNPKRLIDSTGQVEQVDGNPFDKPGVDLMVASWHYARGTKQRPPEVLYAKRFFDLIVIDEAHSARKKRSQQKIEPTLLNNLCMELSTSTPHILMLSATPVQLYTVEAHDLLRILGLGGPWVHERDFDKYYRIIETVPESVNDTDWKFALQLAGWVARNYLTETELTNLLKNCLKSDDVAMDVKAAMQRDTTNDSLLRSLKRQPDVLRRLLLELSPIHWFMIRNTRAKLTTAGYKFPERQTEEVPVELDAAHQQLLDRLDSYLRLDYAKYERLLSTVNRGIIGFVRSVYHQRFVSSFTAAYLTIRNRRQFLQALLDGDHDSLLKVAVKFLEDVDWDGDEDDIVEAMDELLEKEGAIDLITKELKKVRELEDDLNVYSPDVLTGDDPKLVKVAEVIQSLTTKGHKVLVFSKYTDTVTAISRFLPRATRLTRTEIAKYTGEGGELFDPSTQSYARTSKENVREALDTGPVRVLVCSDAASEGLNLQAANAVINVDMPWNPAKVEQRIGRSDRLGQDAPRVVVRNVWYPETIEAEMYRVLFERKTLYQLVIGPAQEIISQAMLQALDQGAKGRELRSLVERTILEVEKTKEQIAQTNAALAWSFWEGRKQDDGAIIERVAAFALRACKALGFDAEIENVDGRRKLTVNAGVRFPKQLESWNGASLDEGRSNALTPAHPIIQWLCDSILSASAPRKSSRSLYVIKDYEGLGELAVIDSEGAAPEVYSGHEILPIIDELLDSGE